MSGVHEWKTVGSYSYPAVSPPEQVYVAGWARVVVEDFGKEYEAVVLLGSDNGDPAVEALEEITCEGVEIALHELPVAVRERLEEKAVEEAYE